MSYEVNGVGNYVSGRNFRDEVRESAAGTPLALSVASHRYFPPDVYDRARRVEDLAGSSAGYRDGRDTYEGNMGDSSAFQKFDPTPSIPL
jgi:hypothetical protein